MQTRSTFHIRNPKSRIRNRQRSAFTLVEMMVVIVIIAVLAGLLIPAIQRARITANETRVVTEINGLASAIAAFKAKYGVEPPSQFVLYVTPAGWSGNPASMAIVRQIWPQFDFTLGAGNPNMTPFPVFWSNPGFATTTANDPNPGLRMSSAECLLFFLGGVIQIQNQGNLSVTVPQGFAKNPAYPFSPPSVSANREGPFFEFTDLSRIKDLDGNGINEFYDLLPNQALPYLYFSSYEGRGYNTFELPSNGANFNYMHDMYRVWSGAIAPATFPLPPTTPTSSTAGTSAALPAQKPQSFQIISPGYDGKYGVGGVFNATLTNSAMVASFNGTTPVFDTDGFDNLTNFNGGRLKP